MSCLLRLTSVTPFLLLMRVLRILRSLEPVQLADGGRLRPHEERLAESTRAAWTGELAGVRIDLDEADAVRWRERNVRASGERPNHELGPAGQRRLGSAEADRLIVVEAEPHD